MQPISKGKTETSTNEVLHHDEVHKKRIWLWNRKVGGLYDNYVCCGSSAKTIKDFRVYNSKTTLRKAYQQDVGNKDLKVPDAYWSFTHEVSVGDIVVVFEPKKGNGKQYHLLHGWGIFTSECTIDENDENPMHREVKWCDSYEIPKQNPEMGNSIFFQGTTDKEALHIKELLNINTEADMNSKYQKYIDLLKTNKNLILTGAPGTGKTFITKEIASQMILKKKYADMIDNEEEQDIFNHYCQFVQFHPSYDYTDFVEGLRPMNDTNGSIGFKRKDGVFKEFCRRCFHNDWLMEHEDVFTSFYESILNDIEKGKIKHIKTPYGSFDVAVEKGRIVYGPDKRTESKDNLKLFYEYFFRIDKFDLSDLGKDDYWKLIEKLTNGKTKTCDYVYYSGILQKMLERANNRYIEDDTPFIFIIDEINRGEISKVFGELFFSIDSGYRGKKGKVNTQYQNLIDENDVFKEGFYIPDNVYIIGTMNDIDRSVESMDFAMRRRFAWQEVTAEESYANMIENDSEFASVKGEIKARMFNLNNAIAETEGLDEAYQIGAAYFRKYLDYQDQEKPFDCLWDNHLKGLLFEYLRGNRRAKELLEKLHEAYNKTSIDEQPAHTNEG